MSGYEYGNARLRALKSQLLGRAEYERLAAADSLEGFIAALTQTAYRQAVEAALARQTGLAVIGAALRRDLTQTINRRRRFYAGEAGDLVMLALLPYDVFNVKTALRGLNSQVSADMILDATLPLGALDEADLHTLATAADARTLIDWLATWQSPLAVPLLRLPAQRSAAVSLARQPLLLAQELALDRWLAATLLAADGGAIWQEMAQIDADITNLMTALRLVGWQDAPIEPTELFVGPGRIAFDRLAAVSRSPNMESGLSHLAATAYAGALQAGLTVYLVDHRLSAFEHELRRYRLNRAARLFVRDPLGIGVVLGYLALKTNEIINLRLIAQNLYLQARPERRLAHVLLVENSA